MVFMDEVIMDDLFEGIKADEDLELEEVVKFRGMFLARTVGSSIVLTAPAAEVGVRYALFVSPRNVLVFVPI
jgi:hypothetical protein